MTTHPTMSPTVQQLLALAERCEAAEGPDRELGREVLRACGWTQATHGHFLEPLTGWTSPDRAIYFDDDDFVRCRHDPTASLDAAMMLVPEGMDWFRERDGFVPFIVSVDGPTCCYTAETDNSLALALVAASLKARAAMETKG